MVRDDNNKTEDDVSDVRERTPVKGSYSMGIIAKRSMELNG